MARLISVESQLLIQKTPPHKPKEWKSFKDILIHTVKGSSRALALSFLLRGGISFLIRLVAVIRGKMGLIQAFRLAFGVEAKRFATMIGTFTFIWKLVSNSLYFKTKKQTKRQGAIAGALAGLSVLIESPENRLVIAQNFSMRAAQGAKNALKQRQLFAFTHGDTLLFSIAVGSIMYAYTMRPHSIPREYYHWMIQHGRVPRKTIEFNRANTHAIQAGKQFATLENMNELCDQVKACPTNRQRFLDYFKTKGNLPNLPCYILHARNESCTNYCIGVWFKTFIDMIPVYGSLNLVPLLVFKTRNVLEDPLYALKKVVLATAQSASFLSTFVFMFQGLLCLNRNLFPDTVDRYLFYYAGLITGLSILVEKKEKRGELAMYVFPKGLQSLYTIMIDNGHMVHIPYLDVISTCGAMSLIMSLYQQEPHQLSPLMYKFMKAIIGTH